MAKKTKRKIRVNRPSYKSKCAVLEEKISEMQAELERAKRVPDPWRWNSADGLVEPRHMTEEHLRNTIMFLLRRITSEFGRVTYTSALQNNVTALHHMMAEALRRGYKF